MLNKKNRIGNRKVIEKLFTKGKLHKDHFLIFKYEEVKSGPSQFAVSVSKKISKKAVKRNYLRRQIHEALRINLHNIEKNLIAFIIARTPCQKITFQEIDKSVKTFFNKLHSNAE